MTKYKAKKVIIGNISFDSQMEADYYLHLLTAYKQADIKLQPVFELQPKFRHLGKAIRAISYIADFQIDNIVYDVKGFKTADFKLKAKIFKYKYADLELVLVTRKNKQWIVV